VGSWISFGGKYCLQLQSQCHYIYIRSVYIDIIVILDRFLRIISQGLSALLLLILARYILQTVANRDTHQPNLISAIIFSSLLIRQNKTLKLSLSTPWMHIGGVEVHLHSFLTPLTTSRLADLPPPPGNKPGYHLIRFSVCPRVGLHASEKRRIGCPFRDSNIESPTT